MHRVAGKTNNVSSNAADRWKLQQHVHIVLPYTLSFQRLNNVTRLDINLNFVEPGDNEITMQCNNLDVILRIKVKPTALPRPQALDFAAAAGLGRAMPHASPR